MGATAAELERLTADYLQNPHVVHDRLREQGPVAKLVFPQGTAAWLVTRYDEARTALADPRLSKDFKGNTGIFAKHRVESDEEPREFNSDLVGHMLNSDPPNHTRLRKLVTKAFTARRMELMRPRVQELTDQLLDEMAQHDEVDLLDAFAFPLPITVICEIMDVPMADRDEFRAWSNALVTTVNPEQAQHAAGAMANYLSEMIDLKRAQPGDDMFSALVHADESGDTLDQSELMAMAFLLLLAGHETTVNLIGNGVLNLLRNPDQLAALRADPSLIKGAVEEFLRYEGPVNQATLRFTTEPVTFGDVTIPTDELVFVSLASANRDTERFPEADRFDITRSTGGHLAFGHGIHFCLGAPLARLEGEVAVNSLLKRFPDLALAAEPDELTWRSSTLMRGLFTLPVRLHS
jgi:cytochrome P450